MKELIRSVCEVWSLARPMQVSVVLRFSMAQIFSPMVQSIFHSIQTHRKNN